jgi:hypothetical protein
MPEKTRDERFEKVGGSGYFIFSLSTQCASIVPYDDRLAKELIVRSESPTCLITEPIPERAESVPPSK